MTSETEPDLYPILQQVRDFFHLADIRVFTWPGCRNRSSEGGITLNVEGMERTAEKSERRLDEVGERVGLTLSFDPSNVLWYVVAHEFAHQLQARRSSWSQLVADPVRHEISADWLAGMVLGWHFGFMNLNPFDAIENAWDVGLSPEEQGIHPRKLHRWQAVEAGVKSGLGLRLSCWDATTELSVSDLLEASYEFSELLMQCVEPPYSHIPRLTA